MKTRNQIITLFILLLFFTIDSLIRNRVIAMKTFSILTMRIVFIDAIYYYAMARKAKIKIKNENSVFNVDHTYIIIGLVWIIVGFFYLSKVENNESHEYMFYLGGIGLVLGINFRVKLRHKLILNKKYVFLTHGNFIEKMKLKDLRIRLDEGQVLSIENVVRERVYYFGLNNEELELFNDYF